MTTIIMYGNTRFTWREMTGYISGRDAKVMHSNSHSLQLQVFPITVVRYKGDGLSYDKAIPTVPSAGTVASITKAAVFYDFKISDLSLKASELKHVAQTPGTGDDIALFKGLLKGNDIFNGANGSDVFHGYNGNDFIDGGYGADRLYGDRGNDRIYGSVGNDRLVGGAGNDELDGEWGNDTLAGGTGHDLLKDSFGGNDRLLGQEGNDRLFGGEGRDVLLGGTGNDFLSGDEGDDRLAGGNGNDSLSGGDGNDILNGGGGADLLDGGIGRDFLIGGAGADRFVFSRQEYTYELDTGKTAATRDVIVDFTPGSDVIDISNLGQGSHFSFQETEGAAFSGGGPQVRWFLEGTSVIMEGDIDGDRVSDFQIELRNQSTISADDIIL